ncbi:MAG: beta-N-acetylhexosaminidase [Alphaproteobacteria bacterium]|nr:beta-N-acetylhexosaminidase [Alphaproteobacteria bacterium]
MSGHRNAGRGTRAVVFGFAGPQLSAQERAFFSATQPFGFILFARNCRDPDQIKALTADLCSTVGRPDAPIFIDEEGGRVQRLKPPHWRNRPPARACGRLYELDPERGLRAAWLHGRLIAADLFPLGIGVDCAPVADVPAPGSHGVIGDRAFAEDARTVARLALAFSEGLRDGGVLPVVKHLPGHGRAIVDSHNELPRVDASLAELDSIDFAPFRALAGLPFGMTAHVLYSAIDAREPATLSARVIGGVIRRMIGFSGILLSDDLSMKALSGSLGKRTELAFTAGCDIVLHCNGDLSEMREVGETTPALSAAIEQRYAEGIVAPQLLYRDAALLELDGLLEGVS